MLESAVKQSVASLRHVYLFIDGLDEFPADQTEALMTLVFKMNAWMLPSLHVYVTSQLHGLSIRSTLETLTTIESRLGLEDYSAVDIVTYIQHCLEKPPFCDRWRGELNFVLDAADGKSVPHVPLSLLIAESLPKLSLGGMPDSEVGLLSNRFGGSR
jgi:hypothetical protein